MGKRGTASYEYERDYTKRKRKFRIKLETLNRKTKEMSCLCDSSVIIAMKLPNDDKVYWISTGKFKNRVTDETKKSICSRVSQLVDKKEKVKSILPPPPIPHFHRPNNNRIIHPGHPWNTRPHFPQLSDNVTRYPSPTTQQQQTRRRRRRRVIPPPPHPRQSRNVTNFLNVYNISPILGAFYNPQNQNVMLMMNNPQNYIKREVIETPPQEENNPIFLAPIRTTSSNNINEESQQKSHHHQHHQQQEEEASKLPKFTDLFR